MEGKCHTCGPQELQPGPVRVYCHTVAALGWPVQIDQPYVCARCGREIRTQTSYSMGHPGRVTPLRDGQGGAGHRALEPAHAMVSMIDGAERFASVQYPAWCIAATRELVPRGEGTTQDGTVVGQHGDPDLMARYAEQYLAAYRTIMPSGRPPSAVVEMMPALHLLVMAAELAMKADLMRSETSQENSAAHKDMRPRR